MSLLVPRAGVFGKHIAKIPVAGSCLVIGDLGRGLLVDFFGHDVGSTGVVRRIALFRSWLTAEERRWIVALLIWFWNIGDPRCGYILYRNPMRDSAESCTRGHKRAVKCVDLSIAGRLSPFIPHTPHTGVALGPTIYLALLPRMSGGVPYFVLSVGRVGFLRHSEIPRTRNHTGRTRVAVGWDWEKHSYPVLIRIGPSPPSMPGCGSELVVMRLA